MDDVSYLPAAWYSGSTQTSVRSKKGVLDETGGPSTIVVFKLQTSLSAHTADLIRYIIFVSSPFIFLSIPYILPWYMHQILVSCRVLDHTGISRKVFSYVGNAHGSTHRCRHCTLGCIAHSRLPCRFTFLRPLSRVPGTQSRRPSPLNGPGPFRHLQLRYFTEKEIYGVWGMVGVHWTAWNGWFVSSCCNGCGVGLPSFPVSPIYSAYLPHINNPVFTTTCCIYYCCTDSRSICFPVKNGGSSWTDSSEKGINSKWQAEKGTCPWLIWLRLSQRYMARFSSCT